MAPLWQATVCSLMQGRPLNMTADSRGAPAAGWRNRIVGHGDVAPAELVPNPAKLEELDEGRQALTIATGWVRSKPGNTEPAPEPDPTR